jgi:predicted transcriptional regulator
MSIDIPDDLLRQLKILASNRRVTLKTLVHRAIEN